MQKSSSKRRLPLLLKTLLWVVGVLIALSVITAVFRPTPEERTAQGAKTTREAAEKLDTMEADGTLYLPKDKMKLMPYLKQGAAQLMASGKCDAIEGASLSEKSTNKDPLFYYHCGHIGETAFGTFKLKVSEIKAGSLKIAPPPEWSSSYDACADFVRQRLNFPSTFDTNAFKTASRTFSDGRSEIVIDFTGKNALSLKLPGSARCLFIPKKGGGYEMEGVMSENRS